MGKSHVEMSIILAPLRRIFKNNEWEERSDLWKEPNTYLRLQNKGRKKIKNRYASTITQQ